MSYPYRKTALSRLVSQFNDKPHISGLVQSMVTPLEEMDTDLIELKMQRWINSAIGTQLDGCGYIVGVARLGRNDEEYRTAIKAQILSNISAATPKALIEGVRFLTSPDEVQYLESYPACALLFTNGKHVPTQSQAILQDIAPASIENIPLMVSYGREKPLRTGRLSTPRQLAASEQPGKKSSLRTHEGKLQVSTSNPEGNARLAGTKLVKTPLSANGRSINVGIGLLSIGSFEPIENGYHLTGVFQ